MGEIRPGDTFSHIIKSLNWKQAVRDAKLEVKGMNIQGLTYICAVPECDAMDRLMFFKHPQNGYEMYLCTPHWRLVQYEMKQLGRKYDTQVNAFAKAGGLDKFKDKNGGKLTSITIFD